MYCILDLFLVLESDSHAFLEAFDREYTWFKSSKKNFGKRLHICLRLQNTQGGSFKAFKTVDERTRLVDHQLLDTHPNPVSYALQRSVNILFSEITDFMLLHAGVVSKNERAVILAGLSGIGKTTLVMKLLERGFKFLSDDFCPIHKETGEVHPFPRSVWVKDSCCKHNAGIGRRGKCVIPISQLPSNVTEHACTPLCLVCLDEGETEKQFCELEMGLKTLKTDLLNKIDQLEGVALSNLGTNSLEWRIRYPEQQGLSARIRKLLKIHECDIWNVFRVGVDKDRPDFEKEPVLTCVSTHAAAFHLLRDLKQAKAFDSEGENRYAPGKFFIMLTQLLEGVHCYRLSVGRLEQMVSKIELLTE